MMQEQTGISLRLRNLLFELRSKRSAKFCELKISIAGQGSADEEEFYYKMIEEKHTGFKNAAYFLSYSEFWTQFQQISYNLPVTTP